MTKKVLFWALVGAILLTPAMSWAVSGDCGGGSVDWTSKVGKPENDPNAPSSYKTEMGDTQKSSSGGGLSSRKRSH